MLLRVPCFRGKEPKSHPHTVVYLIVHVLFRYFSLHEHNTYESETFSQCYRKCCAELFPFETWVLFLLPVVYESCHVEVFLIESSPLEAFSCDILLGGAFSSPAVGLGR